jgi:hypothetical protein
MAINNNLKENQTHPVILVRENNLFCGLHENNQLDVIIYSLHGICKQNNLTPQSGFEIFHKRYLIENQITSS